MRRKGAHRVIRWAVDGAAARAVLGPCVDVGQLLTRPRRVLAHLGGFQIAGNERQQRRDCPLLDNGQVNPDAREDGGDNGGDCGGEGSRRHLGMNLG